MSLQTGARLGPYEIQTPLGAGGMGEVYKARDTRLDRTVAVKVLPAELAGDPEFRQRFDREAKTISQLSHPNICVLHDVGHDAGMDFLVMEFLDGETLAQRLDRGPIPFDETLKLAAEIADALDNAHRAGVVHRDLKPGNVMLTRAGAARTGQVHVKLLDFGLAKPSSGQSSSVSMLTSPPTRTTPLTARGMILGTFQYMSPEQIEGAEADARSDIWAFGCVLHEMLTGTRVFEGKTHASLIGAILKDQPKPISALHPAVPPGVDRIVATCLAKDPDERWQSAADLARELKWVATGQPGAPHAAEVPAGGVGGRERLLWASAVLVAAVATWSVVAGTRPAQLPSGGPTTRAVIALSPEDAMIANPNTPGLGAALSGDGAAFVYTGRSDGQAHLFVRNMADGRSRPVPGTEGGTYPAFSPDSQSIAFVAGRAIRRVVLGGGAPVSIIDGLPSVRGMAWGDDEQIYYTPQYGVGLWRVSAAGGGTPDELTTPDRAKGEKTHRLPFVLPGSKAVLFVVGGTRDVSFDEANIDVLSLETRERKRLIQGGTFPQYLPSGHLLYSHGQTIVAVGFDADRLEVTGNPVVVATGVLNRPAYGGADFGVSRAGTLVSVPATVSEDRRLLSVDRRGQPEPIRVEAGFGSTARVSPEGTRIASFMIGATSQIGIGDLRRGGGLTKITFEWDNEYPLWTVDGARIVFSANHGGGAPNLYWQSADGSGRAERLTTSDYTQRPGWRSSPGPMVPFVEVHPVSLADVWMLSLEDRTVAPVVQTPYDEDFPALSPNGKWLAYQSNRSGPWEVYVQAYPSNGRSWPISSGGGTAPLWTREGNELLYRRGAAVMVVPVQTSPEFRAGEATKLFDSADVLLDVMPDGRFLMSHITPPPPVTSLNLVVNWFDELRRKTAPGGR
jgi:eukaryotic-like serine/threonine-protein kinase